jgi:(methylthio)acryloyl-CoA hydratase
MTDQITYDLDGDVALIGINRPSKRNAMHDEMFTELGVLADRAAAEARAAVIFGVGPHFCAGLDLADVMRRVTSGVAREPLVGRHAPHVAFDKIARGTIPFVTALTGAVVGAGLEIAAAAQLRVADDTAFFALPEAQRGRFVGAGGSVRIQYRAAEGEAMNKAVELAHAVAENAPATNWSIIQGLARVNDMSYDDALYVETLVAQNSMSGQSETRLRDFLEKRAKPLDRPTR